MFTHLAIDVNMEFNGQLVAEIKLFKFKMLLGKKLFFHKAVLRKPYTKSPAPANSRSNLLLEIARDLGVKKVFGCDLMVSCC